MSYCHDCYNTGYSFEPDTGWVGCHCGRCEDKEGNEMPKPTFGTWLHFLVKTALVEALKDITKAQREAHHEVDK